MNAIRSGATVGMILWLSAGVAAGGPLNPANFTSLGTLSLSTTLSTTPECARVRS
jgi:hypothetical protein